MREACGWCRGDAALRGTIQYAVETERLTGKLDFKASLQEGVYSVYCAAAGVLIMITGSALHTGLQMNQHRVGRKYVHTYCTLMNKSANVGQRAFFM